MSDIEKVVDLFKRVVAAMCDHPDSLVVTARPLRASVSVSVQAHAVDTSRLIGSGGQNYWALSTIASAIGARRKIRVKVPPIREPVVGEPARFEFKADPNWPRARILALLDETLAATFFHPVASNVDDDEEFFTTTVEVTMDRRERMGWVDRFGNALAIIFDAIGRTNGRVLMIDFIVDAEPAQPESAAGRNMPEIER